MQRHDCDYHDFMDMQGTLKEKVVSRFVEGDSKRITNAREVVVEEATKSKKNFGGSGVTSGNLNKVNPLSGDLSGCLPSYNQRPSTTLLSK